MGKKTKTLLKEIKEDLKDGTPSHVHESEDFFFFFFKFIYLF